MRALSSLTLSIAIASAVAGARPARADDSAPQKEAAHARISFVEGDLFVRGPFDSEEQNLALNSIIREGDIIRSADNARGEIELPDENFLRVSANTVARVDHLATSIELSVIEGAAYVSHGNAGGDAVVNTKMGGVGLAPGAVVRIEATRVDQTMLVRVAAGGAEATCQEAAEKVGKGDTYTCGQGAGMRGQWDVSKGDAFDRWNAEREEHVRHYSAAPPEIAGHYEGLYDLEGQGTWVSIDNGWYWQPTVVVTDWRPYYDGYWGWYGGWGWTWIPYTSWGYTTHHYGRWIFRGGYGWIWSPAPVWAGSWVVWGTFGGYVGWAPCDFWGRPIMATSRYSYYDPAVWSFGHAGYFYAGGGNYLHGSYAARNGDVVGAVAAAGHDRPFFHMSHDQISSVRASPVRDAQISLAPKIAGDRPSLGSASSRAAILGNMQPAATRPGPLLSRLAEQERTGITQRAGSERTGPAASAIPGVSPGQQRFGAATHVVPSDGGAPGAARIGEQHAGAGAQAHAPATTFTRPSFTRQQPAQSQGGRIDSFNRWSAARARQQSERDNEAPVSTGEHHEAINPGTHNAPVMSSTPHTTQQPVVRESAPSSGWGRSSFGGGGGGFGHPSGGGGGGFSHPSGGGGSSSTTYRPSFSAPHGGSAPAPRPSSGGHRR